jgi:hypothetical protein
LSYLALFALLAFVPRRKDRVMVPIDPSQKAKLGFLGSLGFLGALANVPQHDGMEALMACAALMSFMSWQAVTGNK